MLNLTLSGSQIALKIMQLTEIYASFGLLFETLFNSMAFLSFEFISMDGISGSLIMNTRKGRKQEHGTFWKRWVK